MDEIGKNIEYESSVLFLFSDKCSSMVGIKTEETDGKFVTKPEYNRIIRKKKIKKINKNEENS